MDDRLTSDLSSLRIDRTRRPGKRGGRRWIIFAALLVVAVLLASAVAFLPEDIGFSSIGAKAREVEVAMVSRQSASADQIVLTAGGYIIPRHRVDVSSKISGRVEELFFEKGDFVKKGQVLVKLDDVEIRAQLAQARAGRAAARARLDEMLAGSRPQEVERAKATLEQAEANLSTAKVQLERALQLHESGVLAKEALDDAQNRYDVASAQARVSKENYELARIGPRQEQIELARAQLGEAEAAVRWAESQLENTVVRAPVDGTILDRVIEKGEMVTTSFFGGRGAKPGFGSMADLRELEVELDINEADIPRVRPRQECSVSPDSYPEREYRGTVREIAPEANRQKATIQVKVSILDPDEYLRPETNAKVNFLEASGEKSAEGRILVPKAAVVRDQESSIVFLLKDGRAERRPVETGKELWGQMEVLSGLSGGEQLVVAGLEGLSDGEKLTLKRP